MSTFEQFSAVLAIGDEIADDAAVALIGGKDTSGNAAPFLFDADGKLMTSGSGGGGGGDATAANQVTGNTSLGNIDTHTTAIQASVGATNDSAASSDTGTFSIIALIKRALSNWTTLQAKIPAIGPAAKAGSMSVTTATDDPLAVVLGTKADAKSTSTDTTQISIVSVLKQISASVQAAAASLAGSLATALADGAHVTFGAKTDAKSTATDTTSISAMSVWKQISASIQAVASTLTGWLSVVGKAAVITATMTRPADTTTYAANDMFGTTTSNSATNIFTLAIARANDATAVISRIRAKINDSGFAGKRIKFHFYKNQPTVTSIGDNGAFGSGAAATESTKIGTATVTFDSTATSDGFVKGYTYPDDTAGVIWTVEPSSGTQNIFAIAEILDATTPGSGKILTLALEVPGQN